MIKKPFECGQTDQTIYVMNHNKPKDFLFIRLGCKRLAAKDYQ